MKWRIYYEDNSTFSNTDGEPWDAPTSGVLVVGCDNDEVGRVLVYGQSYYFWWEEHKQWWAGNIIGLFDYLNRPGPRKVLFGREVPGKDWNRAIYKAENDPYLPPKTALHPMEKKMQMIRD